MICTADGGGGYTCDACPAGYEGDGESCLDDDECGSNPCFAGVICTDAVAPATGYSCGDCTAGYEGDGETCTDLDACLFTTCNQGETCFDEPPPSIDATCSACPSGQEGAPPNCTEIDGCAIDPCYQGVQCTDRPAPQLGFDCAPCPVGLQGDGIQCTEIDSCDASPCFTGVICTDIPAPGDGYSCGNCTAGYEGDGETCTNIDSCDATPCFTGVTCTDIAPPGDGYVCDACPSGYVGDGETCVDDDECIPNPCFAGVQCTDAIAPAVGYDCGFCPSGYVGNGETCTDFDACSAAPCAANEICVDDVPPSTGFSCTACGPGEEGTPPNCTDIDGCAGVPCFTGVACTDVMAPGTGYTCDACPAGYEGDGETCTNVDSCNPDPCYIGVICTDDPPPDVGYTCGSCPSGLEGDGETCTEIDGCVADPCYEDTYWTATCNDILAPGLGFTCGPCHEEFTGDGEMCMLIPAGGDLVDDVLNEDFRAQFADHLTSSGGYAIVGAPLNTGSADIGGTVVNWTTDGLVIARFNDAGGTQFARFDAAGYTDELVGVGFSSSNRTHVAGELSGTQVFGVGFPGDPMGGRSLTSDANHQNFVVRYALNGNLAWARHFGGGSIATGIDSTGDNRALVTGEFDQSVYFGGIERYAYAGSDGIYLIRTAPNGNFAWVRTASAPSQFGEGPFVTGGPVNQMLWYGSSAGAMSFDDGAGGTVDLPAPGTQIGLYMSKYDAMGTLSWAKNVLLIGSLSRLGAYHAAIASDGSVYALGYATGIMTFGAGEAGELTRSYSISTLGGSLILMHFNAAGEFQWVRSMMRSTASNAIPTDAQVTTGGASDGAVISVDYSGDYIFGEGTPREQSIAADGIVTMRYRPTGSLRWVRQTTVTGNDTLLGVFLQTDGEVMLVGEATPPDVTFDQDLGPVIRNLAADTVFSALMDP